MMKNELRKCILVVQVEGKREGWGDGKDLSLILPFLCVAASVSVMFHTAAANTLSDS